MELEIMVGKEVDERQIKAIQKLLLPFAESITNDHARRENRKEKREGDLSMYDKLKNAISVAFRYGQWFTSLDAQEIFEEFYGEQIRLSTCSTYLRRLEDEGFLVSRKIGKLVEYRLVIDAKDEGLVRDVRGEMRT